jgi:hypothetical protein
LLPWGHRVMADIIPFLAGQTFDPAMTRIMGEAFDSARRELHDRGQPAVVQEIIAKRIIEIAATGLRDPEQLALQALGTLGIGA